MKAINEFSKTALFSLSIALSSLFLSSCATDPGSIEALNSASAQRRNIIGVELSNITHEQRTVTKYAGDGVYVSAVIPKHPADIAGLKPGDIIVSINRIPISNTADALTVISRLEGGQKYPFRIFRIRSKSEPGAFESNVIIFAARILIERVQERAIGRIS